jgi:hypothetical protein
MAWSFNVELLWTSASPETRVLESLLSDQGGSLAELAAQVRPEIELADVQNNMGPSIEPCPTINTDDFVMRPFSTKNHAWTNGSQTSIGIAITSTSSTCAITFSAIYIRLLFPLGLSSSLSSSLTMHPSSKVSVRYLLDSSLPNLNVGQQSSNFLQIRDVVPPDFGSTCPGNYTIILGPGAYDAHLTHEIPIATDRGQVVRLYPNIPYGEEFAITLPGQPPHRISYFAADLAGNQVLHERQRKRKKKEKTPPGEMTKSIEKKF